MKRRKGGYEGSRNPSPPTDLQKPKVRPPQQDAEPVDRRLEVLRRFAFGLTGRPAHESYVADALVRLDAADPLRQQDTEPVEGRTLRGIAFRDGDNFAADGSEPSWVFVATPDAPESRDEYRAVLTLQDAHAEPVEGRTVNIEGLHPELWERLVPELKRMADLAEPDPVPKTFNVLSSHRATLREAAQSITRLREEVARLRARVQSRRVSREDLRQALAWYVEARKAGIGDLVSGFAYVLGLQIEGNADV